MARLVVESGGERREYAVDREVVLGRQKTCAVVLDEKTISREHVRVFRDGARYVVEDLGSRSGSFLNSRRLSKTETLAHGDTIRLGPFTLRFLLDPSEGSNAGASTNAEIPSAARARPRTPAEAAATAPRSEALVFAMYVFLLAILGGVAWASRIGFGWLLDRVIA